MADAVVDASVVIKWVVEAGSDDAVALLEEGHALCAPDLMVPECANIFWKKVRRRELMVEEARTMATLLQRATVELAPTRPFMVDALNIAHALDHPAYDGFYLALAMNRQIPLITADVRLVQRVAERGPAAMQGVAVSLSGWRDRLTRS